MFPRYMVELVRSVNPKSETFIRRKPPVEPLKLRARKYKFPSTALFCLTLRNLNQNIKILKNLFSICYKFSIP